MVDSTATVAVEMQAIEGFVSFASTLRAPNNTGAFFFNIHNTFEGAVASNMAGNANAEEDPNNNVPHDAVLMEETAGQILFDYLCADDAMFAEEEEDDAHDSAAASQAYHVSYGVGAMVICVAAAFLYN